jgi:hypothetical protein
MDVAMPRAVLLPEGSLDRASLVGRTSAGLRTGRPYHAYLATDRVTVIGPMADGRGRNHGRSRGLRRGQAHHRDQQQREAREVNSELRRDRPGPPDADRVHPAFGNLFVETVARVVYGHHCDPTPEVAQEQRCGASRGRCRSRALDP